MFIYERPEWPHFTWDPKTINPLLTTLHYQQGRLMGRMQDIGFHLKEQALVQTLTQDVVKSSEIEGEILNTGEVRSSVARRLGIHIGGLVPSSRSVDGIVEMMLDATQHYDLPLTRERLFAWHASLFPVGQSGLIKIKVGSWREDKYGPMQVVSGPYGYERVHYQAPPADCLDKEMAAFMAWFSQEQSLDLILKAGLAHLWFVTLHPFDDGNGRIARAIGDMALAQSEQSTQRFYSLSSQILAEREAYYNILERTQKGDLDITFWMEWFLSCLLRAIENTETTLNTVLYKAHFWEKVSGVTLNDRQRKILSLLLEDFEGKLTTSKWAKIAKCSQDTAHRDIAEPIQKGILVINPEGGRSTSYSLAQLLP